jgi:acyl-coenzyme A thioesterase PaaI-like protein
MSDLDSISATLAPMDDAVEHFSQQGFLQFLAFDPVEAGGGRSLIRLDPKPEHLNHNGTVNATVLYGLAEVAGAGAVVADMLDLAAQSYTVVKKATIEYLATARGAVEAVGTVATSEVERAKAAVLSGEPVEVLAPVLVTDHRGTEVASVEFTVAIRPKRKAE